MLNRVFKDVIQFLGLMCLLGIGTFGFYIAMAAYQLCQLERDCPLYRFQEPHISRTSKITTNNTE